MREITDKKELERLMGKSPKGKAVEPIKAIPAPGRRLMTTTVETGIRGTPPPADPGDTPMMKAAREGISVGTIDPACLRGDECAGEPGDGFAIRDLPDGGRITDEDWNAALARLAPVAGPNPEAWLPRLVRTEDVIPTPDNPRRKIDETSPKFLELVASVKGPLGIIQPLVGRPHPTRPGKIDLRCGHRRHRAAEVAGLEQVPITVREMDDRTAMEITVMENMAREDLTPLEEARGVQALLDTGHNLDEIAASMRKTRGWLRRRAALCGLTAKWKEFAEEQNVSAAHLDLIARYDKPTQTALWDDLVKGGQWQWERYFAKTGALDALKAFLAERNKELKLAPWDLADELLQPKAGACSVCPKRSGCQEDLFEEEMQKGGDRCLDAACWGLKMEALLKRQEAELKAKFPALIKVAGKGGNTDRGKDVVSSWDYDVCAKSAPGALPALVVSGSNAGKQVWVKCGRTPAAKKVQTAAVKQAAASLDPKASAKLLAEKREAHEKRRWALVCRKLQQRIEESDLPPHPDYRTPEGMVALAASFGMEPLPYQTDRKGPWDQLTAYRGREAMQRLWQAVRQRVMQTLNVFTVGDLGKDHHRAIEGATMLLCLVQEEVKAEADEDIPEPKSFELLERLAEAPPAKAKEPAKDKERPAKRPPLSKPGPGMFGRGVDPEADDAPFDEGHAKAAYLGKVVITNYGTGPYVVIDVSGPCQCSEKGEGKHTEWHVHLTCRDKEPQKGKGMLSFLAGYRLDGTSVWNSDRLLVDDDTPAAKPAKKSAKKKGAAA